MGFVPPDSHILEHVTIIETAFCNIDLSTIAGL
jgi:hypothetical protein